MFISCGKPFGKVKQFTPEMNCIEANINLAFLLKLTEE